MSVIDEVDSVVVSPEPFETVGWRCQQVQWASEDWTDSADLFVGYDPATVSAIAVLPGGSGEVLAGQLELAKFSKVADPLGYRTEIWVRAS